MGKRYHIVDLETEQNGFAVTPLYAFDDDVEGDRKLMEIGNSYARKLALIDTQNGRNIINTSEPKKATESTDPIESPHSTDDVE